MAGTLDLTTAALAPAALSGGRWMNGRFPILRRHFMVPGIVYAVVTATPVLCIGLPISLVVGRDHASVIER